MNDKHQHSYPRIGLLIDGEWIYDRPPLCDVENPSDETILGQVPKASQQDLQNALEIFSARFRDLAKDAAIGARGDHASNRRFGPGASSGHCSDFHTRTR